MSKPDSKLVNGPIEELVGNPSDRGEAVGAGQGAERTSSPNAAPERQFQVVPGAKAERG